MSKHNEICMTLYKYACVKKREGTAPTETNRYGHLQTCKELVSAILKMERVYEAEHNESCFFNESCRGASVTKNEYMRKCNLSLINHIRDGLGKNFT